MSFLILGFITGISLIFAIGAQNIFVVEQGLKKNYIFIVCLICAISDFLLIFSGIFLFHYFDNFFTPLIELILNILLLIFLLNFIWGKIKIKKNKIEFSKSGKNSSFFQVICRTIGFTYFNPHVYSDTVFFLGNFSKNFLISHKYFFGIGASIASFLFFFSLGYLAKFFSNYLIDSKAWKIINFFIIIFMTVLSGYVFIEIIDSI